MKTEISLFVKRFTTKLLMSISIVTYAILYNISLILNDQLEDDEEKENLSNKIPMVNLEKIDNEILYKILSLNDCSDKIYIMPYICIYIYYIISYVIY